jgi:hypothetical protein
MIRASLYGVSVIAFHPEGSAAMWRKNAPNALGDRCRFFAASRNVCAAGSLPVRVAADFTVPSAKYRLLSLSRERSTSRWIALHFFWPQGPAW